MADQPKQPDRREFITRAGKAGLSIAAAGFLSYKLYDADGPQPGVAKEEQVKFPDIFSTNAPKAISIVKGADRSKTVEKAIDLLGGIEQFIKKGETVILKPNVAFATPAILGATVHPDVITKVVRLCYDRGGEKKVYVTDNPINDPASCFTLSGVAKAATEAGAEVIMPKDHLFKRSTLKNGTLIQNWPIYYEPFTQADKLIGITPVKDHHRSGASMTLKNWYGLLGGRRNIFHQDIHTIISELGMMVKPTFVILDGTKAMMSNGPTGGSINDLKQTNTMIASTDMVAADSFGCSLLNLKVSDLPFLTKAEKAGVGTADYASLKPKTATIS